MPLVSLTADCHQPGAQAPCPQPHEDGADELPEGGGVDGVQFVLLAVPQVMVVQGAPGQAHTLCCLVVIQQPLQLQAGKNKQHASLKRAEKSGRVDA